MTQGSASHREDVEQLGRRFLEFRSTHPVRSRLPEELWAAAAKLARRDGIEATALALDVDRPSLQKWTDRFEPSVQLQARLSFNREECPGLRRFAVDRGNNRLVAISQAGGDHDVELVYARRNQAGRLNGCRDSSDGDRRLRRKTAELKKRSADHRCRGWSESIPEQGYHLAGTDRSGEAGHQRQ